GFSSSFARYWLAALHSEVLILIQPKRGPDWYGASFRLHTMPSNRGRSVRTRPGECRGPRKVDRSRIAGQSVLGLRRFLIAVDECLKLSVDHAAEFVSAARRDLFHVEAPELAALHFGSDCRAQHSTLTRQITQCAHVSGLAFGACGVSRRPVPTQPPNR